MSQSSQIKDAFFECLSSISETPWLYTEQNNHFSRNRKISFADTILSTICIQRSSLKTEVLKYFNFLKSAPSHSALIQQRSKVNPCAFEDLLTCFTEKVSPNLTCKGYRLFAVDGSDIHIPRNPNDPDTYRITDAYGKGFNMLHLNAAYDLMSHLFCDIIIQPVNHVNEYRAMCEMIDHFSEHHPDQKAVFIADRGFVSLNVFAHAIENGSFFLIRGRDPDSKSLLYSLNLPDEPEFDITFERWLTRRNTKTIKAQPEIYKSVASGVFDYLEPKSTKLFYICFRIIKLLLPNGTTEYIFTNLPKEDFSKAEIQELYNRRWGIETSFRDIKYAAGMLYFHSRKKQLVLQEIYAKLILYNFSEAITRGVAFQKANRKLVYKINFSLAIFLCVEYLRQCKQGLPLMDMESLLSKHLIPVRPGRSSPRYKKARTAITFMYR